MRRTFDLAFAFAMLVAIVWAALAAHMAAQGACSGPTVAMVKPFGLTITAAAQRSEP